MCKTLAYMRISTNERWSKENNTEIPERRIYRDDASGKSFDRPAWQELESDVAEGDTNVFKDICRFTREYENGFDKYMTLLNKGVNLIFIDNPTVSTDYIKSMMEVADKQSNRIAKKSLKDTIELLLLVELDRAEKEREITVQRIRDGIAASEKKSGRPKGKLDKMTAELEADLKYYVSQSVADRTMTAADLMRKYNLSRNTVKKYIAAVQAEADHS